MSSDGLHGEACNDLHGQSETHRFFHLDENGFRSDAGISVNTDGIALGKDPAGNPRITIQEQGSGYINISNSGIHIDTFSID